MIRMILVMDGSFEQDIVTIYVIVFTIFNFVCPGDKLQYFNMLCIEPVTEAVSVFFFFSLGGGGGVFRFSEALLNDV